MKLLAIGVSEEASQSKRAVHPDALAVQGGAWSDPDYI
jgi:hypothetical protein